MQLTINTVAAVFYILPSSPLFLRYITIINNSIPIINCIKKLFHSCQYNFLGIEIAMQKPVCSSSCTKERAILPGANIINKNPIICPTIPANIQNPRLLHSLLLYKLKPIKIKTSKFRRLKYFHYTNQLQLQL